MIVVDVETTGTVGSKHSILSIGGVDIADPTRRFYDVCRVWEAARVSKKALEINGFSEEEIHDPGKQTEAELVREFLAWYAEGEEQTFVGMNPSLDMDFVREAADRADADYMIAKRSIDLHTVCYMHMTRRGVELPVEKKHSAINSDFISAYVGIPPEPKPHVALNGALWEAEQLSRLLYNRPFLDEFKSSAIPWLK